MSKPSFVVDLSFFDDDAEVDVAEFTIEADVRSNIAVTQDMHANLLTEWQLGTRSKGANKYLAQPEFEDLAVGVIQFPEWWDRMKDSKTTQRWHDLIGKFGDTPTEVTDAVKGNLSAIVGVLLFATIRAKSVPELSALTLT